MTARPTRSRVGSTMINTAEPWKTAAATASEARAVPIPQDQPR